MFLWRSRPGLGISSRPPGYTSGDAADRTSDEVPHMPSTTAWHRAGDFRVGCRMYLADQAVGRRATGLARARTPEQPAEARSEQGTAGDAGALEARVDQFTLGDPTPSTEATARPAFPAGAPTSKTAPDRAWQRLGIAFSPGAEAVDPATALEDRAAATAASIQDAAPCPRGAARGQRLTAGRVTSVRTKTSARQSRPQTLGPPRPR